MSRRYDANDLFKLFSGRFCDRQYVIDAYAGEGKE